MKKKFSALLIAVSVLIALVVLMVVLIDNTIYKAEPELKNPKVAFIEGATDVWRGIWRGIVTSEVTYYNRWAVILVTNPKDNHLFQFDLQVLYHTPSLGGTAKDYLENLRKGKEIYFNLLRVQSETTNKPGNPLLFEDCFIGVFLGYTSDGGVPKEQIANPPLKR